MPDELIFHLGDCKTGSTALQSALSGRRYTLAEGSILYRTSYNHAPLAHALNTRRDGAGPDPALRRQRFTALAAGFEGSSERWGIVSAEHFEFVRPEALAAALDEFLPGWQGRTRLIAYVRPHAERLVSGYAELVKTEGLDLSMDAHFERRQKAGMYLYSPRFMAWQQVFGAAFTLRPYIRSRLEGGDVVADFFQWLTGDARTRLDPGGVDNAALSVADLAMMREVHRVMGLQDRAGVELRRQMGWNFGHILNGGGGAPGDRLRIDRALYDRLREALMPDAAALDAAFFDGRPMQQAMEDAAARAVDVPQSLAIEDHFPAAEIARTRAWASLAGRMAEADPEHFKWAVKPAAERGPVPGQGIHPAAGSGDGATVPAPDAAIRPEGKPQARRVKPVAERAPRPRAPLRVRLRSALRLVIKG